MPDQMYTGTTGWYGSAVFFSWGVLPRITELLFSEPVFAPTACLIGCRLFIHGDCFFQDYYGDELLQCENNVILSPSMVGISAVDLLSEVLFMVAHYSLYYYIPRHKNLLILLLSTKTPYVWDQSGAHV